MWNIILLNEQCPFVKSIKRENQKYWPCDHEMNHRKVCVEKWCPVAASQQPVEDSMTKFVKKQQDMPPEFNQVVDQMLDDEIANG